MRGDTPEQLGAVRPIGHEPPRVWDLPMGVDTWQVGPGRKGGHLLRKQKMRSIRESKESIRPLSGHEVSKSRLNGRGGDAHLKRVEGHRHRASRRTQRSPIRGEVPLIRI